MLIGDSGEPKNRNLWLQCARNLARDDIFRAIGQFEEKSQLEDLHNSGAILTAIIKDIALRKGVKIE